MDETKDKQPKVKVFDTEFLRREDKIKHEAFVAEMTKLDDTNIINDAKLISGVHLMSIPIGKDDEYAYVYALGGYTLDEELQNKLFRAGYIPSDNKLRMFNLYLMPIVSSSGSPIAIETTKMENIDYTIFILPEDYAQFNEDAINAISKNGIMLKYLISVKSKDDD